MVSFQPCYYANDIVHCQRRYTSTLVRSLTGVTMGVCCDGINLLAREVPTEYLWDDIII